MKPHRPPGSRWSRASRRVARGALLVATFVVALVLAVLAHLNTPAVRHSITELTNRALSDLLYGRIEVDRIERLSVDGIELGRVTLWDTAGAAVIVLDDVRADIDVLQLLADLWLSTDKLNVVLEHTRVEHSEVRLIPDEQAGELTLSRALTPRPRPPRAPSERGVERYVRVWLPHVELGTVVGELGIEGLSDISPRLTNVRGRVLFSPKGIAVDVERFGTNLEGVYGTRIHGSGAFSLRAPGPLELDFTGFAGDAEVQAHLALERGEITADATMPLLTPEAMRQWWEDWPLSKPVSAQVHATGVWPELSLDAEVSAASGVVDINGALDLSRGLDASLEANVAQVQLQQLIDGAPELRLDLRARAAVELRATTYRVVVDGSSEATNLDGVELPPTRFELEATDSTGPTSLVGKLELLEPGGTLHVHGNYGDGILNSQVSAPRVQLRGHRRLPRGLSGLTSFSADVSLERDQLRVSAEGQIRGFQRSPVAAQVVDFVAEAKAPVANLQQAEVDLQLRASQLQLDQLTFERATLTAKGNRRGADVALQLWSGDEQRVRVRGFVRHDLSVSDARVAMQRDDVRLDADVRRFDWNAGVIDIQRVSVHGHDGQLDGRLRVRPGTAEGALSARNLQLARLVRRLSGAHLPLRGRFDFDTEFSIGPDVQRGRVTAAIAGLSVTDWGDSNVKLLAALDGRHLTGALTGTDELGFTVSGNLNARLGGHALELESYRTATGTSELSVLGIPLGPLGLLLPKEQIAGLDGKVGVRALLQRTEPEGFPNAFVELGLSVESAKLTGIDPPLQLDYLNAYVSAAYAASERQLNAVATVGDVHGQLVGVNAGLKVNATAWLHDPSNAAEEFIQTPLSVIVNLPRRSLARLPLTVPEGITGSVEAQLALFGTAEQPRISVLLNAQDVLAPGVHPDSPLNVNVNGQYAPRTGDIDLSVVAASKGRSVLLSRLDGLAPWHDDDAGAATSHARVALDRLPLGLFAPLVDADISGDVSGQLFLRQGAAPELGATLDFSKLRSGRAALGNATMHLKGEPGNVLMHFAVDDTQHPLLVRLSADATTTQVPLPNQLESVNIALRAQRVDAAALSPMLESFLARVGGQLDADVSLFLTREASVEPGEPHRWRSSLEGEAHLSDGTAYIDALGLELRDITVDVRAEPRDGMTVVGFENFRARARSQEVNLEGQGQLSLQDAQVQAGTAALRLRSVPLALQGLNLGRARGQALAKFERRQGWDRPDSWLGKDYLQADVELLDWVMEAAPSASRRLIDLDDHPEIVIVQARDDRETNPSLTPLRVVVHLSDRTLFRLADIEVPLQGEVRVDVTDESTMSGALVLRRGGRVPLFGQVFRIVDGKLRLNPKDPGNPGIDITLVGRGSDDEVVYVTISGTLEEMVTQPGPAELQALLGGGAATALGSGVQVLGVNQLLGSSVQLRVGSADDAANETSYGASIQLDDNLWFEAAYQRNQNMTLNQEQSEIVSGTLDYRFANNWAWRTKVGNTGGSVDLLWQYRY